MYTKAGRVCVIGITFCNWGAQDLAGTLSAQFKTVAKIENLNESRQFFAQLLRYQKI